MRDLIRLVLTCAVVTLLLVTAAAPRLRASAAAGRAAQPLWPSYPACTLPLVNTGWTTTIDLPPFCGTAQPVALGANIAACSLKVSPSYTFGRLDVVQWDGAALRPDPTTVALRSVVLNSSNMAWNWLHIPMSPPLVTRSIAHVAQAPSASGAVLYTGLYPYNVTSFRYSPAGDPSMPVGLYLAGASYAALPGSHPVHGLSLCGGGASLQELRVVQSVMSTDVKLDMTRFDLLQRFRVPRAVRLQWVEFAIDSSASWNAVGSVAILRDGMAGAFPPLEVPPALLSASFSSSYTGFAPTPSWASHFDFDSSLVLQPGVDYWLRLTPAHQFKIRAHALTGAEDADFTSAIGPLWSRTENGQPWDLEPNRALSFRIVGDTTSLVGVDPAPMRSPLELRATPNPSRGTSVLAWSGAVGSVRFEVLDARGRRVGAEARAPGVSGQWIWVAASAGRPLAPGLYFVRARDGAGHTAIARVVLVK